MGSVKEHKLEKHISDARQATTDVRARASAAESNVKVLEADLHKQKADVNCLKRKLAEAKACNTELELDLHRKKHNLPTVQDATWEASTCVLNIRAL